MPIEIKSTNTVGINGIKCLVYGDAGVGKTMLASTADNCIIVATEQGLLSLRKFDLPYIEVNTIKDLSDSYALCKKSEYKTIYVDSLSEIAEKALTNLKKTGEFRDMRQAYGAMADEIMAIIRMFRDIPQKNVVVTSKLIRRTDEDTGITTFEPGLPGKVLPYNLPYMFDLVLCLQRDKKGERFIQTDGNSKIIAKDRSGTLEFKEKPDLNHIFNTILKDL